MRPPWRGPGGPADGVPAPVPVRALLRRLLPWFATHARDLPWRHTRDPYAIWVAEIMLQQTQVATVIGYWTRWLQALPDLPALARAPQDQVLKLWEGLGYYARARNLQRAAQQLTREGARSLPPDYAVVLALPGVGRYTAGAICSLAFNLPTPVLDGNVQRVLARVFGVRGVPRDPPVNRRLWALAESLVRGAALITGMTGRACGDCNEALMELGAVVCVPRQPRCDACPLRPGCVAFRDGLTDQLPEPGRRPIVQPRRVVAFVAERRGQCWVRQRPPNGINAGLWEFPNLEVDGDPADLPSLARQILGVAPGPLTPLRPVRHSITRYRITLEAFRLTLTRSPRGPGCWCDPASLERLALTAAHRRIAGQLRTPPSGH